jgi:hypothetical protein
MYSFRIRYKVAPRSPISVDTARLDLPGDPEYVEVRLSSVDGHTPIAGSELHAVVSDGYASEGNAWRAAIAYRGYLVRCFAKLRIAADFGDRAAKSVFTEAGLRILREEHDRPVLNDVHGMMVYPTAVRPLLASSSGMGVALRTDGASLQAMLFRAIAEPETPSEQEILAYDLFSASFFESSADTRLLLLMMAVETLIEVHPRSASAIAHVDDLIAQTGALSTLAAAERASLCGTLAWLRNESIGQAGRRLAKTLGTRRYHGMRPAEFFTWVYGVRSNLVHGAYPRPSREVVGSAAATLEGFVSDLLAGRLRNARVAPESGA